MSTLLGRSPKDTFRELLKVSGTINGSLMPVTDGSGVNSALSISAAGIKVSGTAEVTSSLTVGGAISTGNSTVNGTNSVTGTSTIGGKLTVNNDASITGKTTLGGETTISGDLKVKGVSWPTSQPVSGNIMKVGTDGKTIEWTNLPPQNPVPEIILKANFVGAVTETIGTSRFYPPSNIVIKKIYCSISNPGTSMNEFDVKVDGISIFDGKQRPSISASQYRSIDYVVSHPVLSTSYITVDVLRASGSDLVVYIVY